MMIYSPYICFDHIRECLAIALFCVEVSFFFFLVVVVVTTYLLACMAGDDL